MCEQGIRRSEVLDAHGHCGLMPYMQRSCFHDLACHNCPCIISILQQKNIVYNMNSK